MMPAAPGAVRAPSDDADADEIVVEPSRGWRGLDLRELVRFRELIYFLTWRDLKVRYKQTALGAAWAIVQPLAATAIFTVFFGRLAGIPSDGLPYPVFALSGIVLWMFFANGLSQASNSLVSGAALVAKVYFPRLVMPMSAVIGGALDLLLATSVLVAFALGYGEIPSAEALLAPLFVVLAFAAALGAGLWFAALNVKFRDVRHAVPFLTQLWLFATPVVYPSSLLDQPWRTLYGLNPMAGAIEGFRWSMLGAQTAPGAMVAVSAGAALALLVGGVYYFRRMERTFADVI